MNLFEHSFIAVDGSRLALDRVRNQPLLLVNTACLCKHVHQFAKLQRLYSDFKGGGLQVVAIPSNSFGELETWDEPDIARFLAEEYRITFPVTAKYPVTGRDILPLFRELVELYGTGILPRWTFHKYLFDRKGTLAGHWPTDVEPDDPALIHQLTRYLQSWRL